MEELRQWRAGRAISIDEAGSLIGVSGVQWHRYENGTRRISPDKVLKVEAITGIPRQQLRPDIFQEVSR